MEICICKNWEFCNKIYSVKSDFVNYAFCQLWFCQLRILSTLILSTLYSVNSVFCQIWFCQLWFCQLWFCQTMMIIPSQIFPSFFSIFLLGDGLHTLKKIHNAFKGDRRLCPVWLGADWCVWECWKHPRIHAGLNIKEHRDIWQMSGLRGKLIILETSSSNMPGQPLCLSVSEVKIVWRNYAFKLWVLIILPINAAEVRKGPLLEPSS